MKNQTDKVFNPEDFDEKMEYDVNYINGYAENTRALDNCIARIKEASADVYDKIWYTTVMFSQCSLIIKDCTKKELAVIRALLGLTGKGKKTIDGSNAKVVYTCDLFGNVDAGFSPIPVDIQFTWDRPESCTLSYETKYVDVDQNDYTVSDDGKVTRKETKAVIDCGKGFMESVFEAETDEIKNAESIEDSIIQSMIDKKRGK